MTVDDLDDIIREHNAKVEGIRRRLVWQMVILGAVVVVPLFCQIVFVLVNK